MNKEEINEKSIKSINSGIIVNPLLSVLCSRCKRRDKDSKRDGIKGLPSLETRNLWQ